MITGNVKIWQPLLNRPPKLTGQTIYFACIFLPKNKANTKNRPYFFGVMCSSTFKPTAVISDCLQCPCDNKTPGSLTLMEKRYYRLSEVL